MVRRRGQPWADGLAPNENTTEVLHQLPDGTTDLRIGAWTLAIDQRCFGYRRLIVAFADAEGTLRHLVHTGRTEPPDEALARCLERGAAGCDAAVAFCDEPVLGGPLPPAVVARWHRLRNACQEHGVHLVDWFQCDDSMFRSLRLALHPDETWWELPAVP